MLADSKPISVRTVTVTCDARQIAALAEEFFGTAVPAPDKEWFHLVFHSAGNFSASYYACEFMRALVPYHKAAAPVSQEDSES